MKHKKQINEDMFLEIEELYFDEEVERKNNIRKIKSLRKEMI